MVEPEPGDDRLDEQGEEKNRQLEDRADIEPQEHRRRMAGVTGAKREQVVEGHGVPLDAIDAAVNRRRHQVIDADEVEPDEHRAAANPRFEKIAADAVADRVAVLRAASEFGRSGAPILVKEFVDGKAVVEHAGGLRRECREGIAAVHQRRKEIQHRPPRTRPWGDPRGLGTRRCRRGCRSGCWDHARSPQRIDIAWPKALVSLSGEGASRQSSGRVVHSTR